MKILVTGGAGYIGSVLVPKLLAKGHAVTVVDALRHNFPTLLPVVGAPGFEFIRGDVRNLQVMTPLYRDADVIVPLAAIVGAPACDRVPEEATAINLTVIEQMLAQLSPSQKVLYPTTNSGYGKTTGGSFCTEDSPLNPVSLYGRTKMDAEKAILDWPNAVTFRLATVFGAAPRMRLDLLVNTFVYEAHTRGYITIYEKDAKRNYVFVDDVADCFLYALEHFDAMKGRCYNLGLDEANLSKADLAELVKRHYPKFAVNYNEIHKDPDQRDYIVSNARLKQAGFAASTTIDAAIPALRRAFEMLPASPFLNTLG